MKKMLFVLVALLIVAPAMAADVEISASAAASGDGNDAVVTISIDASASAVGIVRALALDITVTGDGDPTITDVNCVNLDYAIYPGSINIAGNGEVSDDGSCLCDSSYAETLDGLDTNGVTIEMGSLYVGAGNAPDDTAVLVEITVAGCDPVDLEIELNLIRGGIVMEDPDAEPTVSLSGTTISDLTPCYVPPPPSCWDAAECAGHATGDSTCDGNINLADLFALKAAFGQNAPWSTVACCSDYNNSGGVNLGDLFVLKAGFGATGIAPSTNNQDCPAP